MGSMECLLVEEYGAGSTELEARSKEKGEKSNANIIFPFACSPLRAQCSELLVRLNPEVARFRQWVEFVVVRYEYVPVRIVGNWKALWIIRLARPVIRQLRIARLFVLIDMK